MPNGRFQVHNVEHYANNMQNVATGKQNGRFQLQNAANSMQKRKFQLWNAAKRLQKVCNMEGSGFKMLCIAYKRKVPPPNNVANGMQSAKFQLPNAAHSMENKHSQESLK